MDIDDLDDDFLSTNGMERHGSELQGEVVFTTTSTANNNVKRAVEYFEDDNQDDALTSTSSGNSTQKESSPFTDFDDVPPPPVAPETPAPAQNRRESASPERQFLDESHLGGIGSPLSQSTRLDETFIEEYSIELDTSGKYVLGKKIRKLIEKFEKKSKKPFFNEIFSVQKFKFRAEECALLEKLILKNSHPFIKFISIFIQIDG